MTVVLPMTANLLDTPVNANVAIPVARVKIASDFRLPRRLSMLYAPI